MNWRRELLCLVNDEKDRKRSSQCHESAARVTLPSQCHELAARVTLPRQRREGTKKVNARKEKSLMACDKF